MQKGDLLRISPNSEIQLYFGDVVCFESKCVSSFRVCNISLLDLKKRVEVHKEDLFVFYDEFFPIGSKE